MVCKYLLILLIYHNLCIHHFLLYKERIHKNGLNEKEYGFNGKNTIVKKVQENKKLNLPGIMFWQLAGDVEVNSKYSLLRSINKNLK